MFLKYVSAGGEPPQLLHIDWGKFYLLLFLTEFSIFKSSIFKFDIDNDFYQ